MIGDYRRTYFEDMAWFRSLTVPHPYLFGIFPVLFLYARNVTELRLGEIFLPLALSAAVVALALLVLSPVIRNRHRGGLLVSAAVATLFLYGPVVEQISSATVFVGEETFTPERLVLAGLLLILLVLAVLIVRCRRDLTDLTRLINQVALILVLIQIGTAGYGWTRRGQVIEQDAATAESFLSAETTPDIYLLVLDAYARSDIQAEIYELDNRDFLDGLADRGFYIADSSHSNYNSTAQSLTSTLNLNYLHRFMATDRGEFSRMPTAVMLENNRVVAQLRKYGYRTVAFATGYAPTEMEYADYYYSPGWTLSEFQNHLLNSTPLPFLMKSFTSQFDLHRERLDYIMNKLPELWEAPSPRFVFAHIDCPHPPFVFGESGEPVQRDWPFSFSDGDHYFRGRGTLDEYLTGYRNQVTYVSGRILKVIDLILAGSAEPPVIILQADHGPGSQLHWESLAETNLRERFSILNAYYLPGADTAQLYRSISPVNSFRVVFNHYFNTQYQMLPDRCYFTTWIRPYNFIDVTENLRPPPEN